MTKPELSRLERITDLRTVWENEATGFTPWLASEDNLALLGDTIGMDLELEATEKDVGPFRADILCKDTATGNWVLVENQLERTDHAHLGQLLTYAAGLKAVTIVWIADCFTEEHRAALDWLNDITDDRFNFFGLEIELWRIGESPVAPKFNVACKPNDWSKTVSTAARSIDDEALTETRRGQLAFWTYFNDLLASRNGIFRSKKPQPQGWVGFPVGRSNFWLSACMHTRDKWLAVYLVCGGSDSKSHYGLLEEDKEAIEKELGHELEWREQPNRKQSYIGVYRADVDPLDNSMWPSHQEWVADTLEAFHRTFSPRVKALDASEYRSEPPEGQA